MIFNIDGISIEVIYQYKPLNRGVYLSYKGGSTFNMSGFFKEDYDKIYDIVIRNKRRMIRAIGRNSEALQPDNTIHFLGRLYEVKYIEAQRNLVYLSENNLVVEHKQNANIEKLIKAFYIDEIKRYTSNRFDDIFKLFGDLNIKRPRLEYKYTTSFYGKCYTKEGRVVLSGMCMKMAPLYIDCVIMHELCHFKYPNHQAGFYRYFEEKMPNAKKIQHEFRSLKYKDIY